MSGRNLDQLIREELSEKLDPQRGRAGQVFTDEIIRPRDRQLLRANASSLRPRNLILFSIVMLLCVVAGMYLSRFLPDNQKIVETPPVAVNPPVETVVIPPDYEHTQLVRMIDIGQAKTTTEDPARRIRQERLDRYQWVDPQTGGTFTYLLPSAKDYIVEAQRQ